MAMSRMYRSRRNNVVGLCVDQILSPGIAPKPTVVHMAIISAQVNPCNSQ